jgi:hypothetical protein
MQKTLNPNPTLFYPLTIIKNLEEVTQTPPGLKPGPIGAEAAPKNSKQKSQLSRWRGGTLPVKRKGAGKQIEIGDVHEKKA